MDWSWDWEIKSQETGKTIGHIGRTAAELDSAALLLSVSTGPTHPQIKKDVFWAKQDLFFFRFVDRTLFFANVQVLEIGHVRSDIGLLLGEWDGRF